MPLDVSKIHVGPGKLTLDAGGANPITFEATEEGGLLSYSRSSEPIEIDEAIGAVGYYITGEECYFEVVAKETDAQLLKAAFGHGTITTTAPDLGVKGSDLLEFGGTAQVTEHTLQYVAPRRHNPNLNIQIDLFKVVAMTEEELPFKKAGQTMYRCRFQAVQDLSKQEGKRLGSILIETAEATG